MYSVFKYNLFNKMYKSCVPFSTDETGLSKHIMFVP